MVAAYQCYCLDKDTELSSFVDTTQSLEDAELCTNSYNLFSNKFRFGFSSINLAPNANLGLSTPPHYCGPIDNGGLYKCGTINDTNPSATAYEFKAFNLTDQTFFPLEKLTLKINEENVTEACNIELPLFESINFTLQYTSCQKPCSLSEDGQLCFCWSFPISIKLDFGDGSVNEFYLTSLEKTGLNLTHYYNATGTFDFQFTARNNMYLPSTNIKVKFVIYREPTKVIPLYIESNVTVIGDNSEILLSVFQGEDFLCGMNYDDDTPEVHQHYANETSLTTIKHRFQNVGVFSVTANCSNLEQFGNSSAKMVIQEPVAGLIAPIEKSISFQDVYKHEWRVIQGSHVTCAVYLDNRQINVSLSAPDPNRVGLGSHFFNQNSNKGVALLPVPKNETHGLYAVVVACGNLVTNEIPVAVTYLSFEIPVKTVQFTNLTETPYFEENQAIPLSLTIQSASNFLIYWRFGDVANVDDEVVEYCHKKDCKSR